jgi:phenylacetate-coenzyme A ligase PaaK-like adenylate-forming protein
LKRLLLFWSKISLQKKLKDTVFLPPGSSFDEVALQVFAYQYEQVPVYREFCDSMRRTPDTVCTLNDIPFLPVQFFKSHEVIAQGYAAEKIFESSTTSGTIPSRHRVADIELYEQSYLRAFEIFYGDPRQYCLLALLPSYLDRGTSSLLYMADDLIRRSGHELSGFINKDFDELHKRLVLAQQQGQKIFLLGVTYALLDFSEQYPMDLSGSIIMETGGMKGRRREMTREELHSTLQKAFNVKSIHSEYGMTELLSQAYSTGDGIFRCPPWMRVIARDPYDPMSYVGHDKTGALNIIDLANLYSCSFLSVSDLGRVYEDSSFEVLGRMDSADIRGCNLMYEL